jgi:hypothetical protein
LVAQGGERSEKRQEALALTGSLEDVWPRAEVDVGDDDSDLEAPQVDRLSFAGPE